jgi:hypothetical protein
MHRYKASWTSTPFVHITSRRCADRTAGSAYTDIVTWTVG